MTNATRLTLAEVALHRIRRAAEQRAKAEQDRKAATARLRRYCAVAHAEGVSISQIAREAHLSRQGVYDLLGHPQPS
jgi:AraC-like DNA-binding protein